MATITAGDIELHSKITFGNFATQTYTITETNTIDNPPSGHNFIFFKRENSFYNIQWDLANSNIDSSNVSTKISSIGIKLNGVGATFTENEKNDDGDLYIRAGLRIDDTLLPSQTSETFADGAIQFTPNETYVEGPDAMSITNPVNVKLRDLNLDTTTTTTGDYGALRISNWDGFLTPTSTYKIDIQPRDTSGSDQLHFGLANVELELTTIDDDTVFAGFLRQGECNMSASFDAEFRDTFLVDNTLTRTQSTDYKRPLFFRQDTGFNGANLLTNAISDRYGIAGATGVCLPFSTVTVAPQNPINHTGWTRCALGYDFTEIDTAATINSTTVRVRVKQPNAGNPEAPYPYSTGGDGTFYGSIRVGFHYFGFDVNTNWTAYQELTDGNFNTYTFTIPNVVGGSDTYGGDTESPSHFGTVPRFMIEFAGVYDPALDDDPAVNSYGVYEISDIEVSINYTGRTFRTTGFLRQDLDTLIADPENYTYKHSTILTESNYAPTTGYGTPASVYAVHFVNDTADNLLNGDAGPYNSYEGGGANEQTSWVNGTTETDEVLLLGVTNLTDDLEATGARTDTLDMTDITTAGFRVRYYNTNTSSYLADSSFTRLAPRVNVAIQEFVRGEADLSASISVATPGTMIHGVVNSEIETYGNEFTLENTGLAGLIRTGFTIDPSSAFDFADTTANNLIGDYPDTQLNTAIDFSNTGLAGLRRTGFAVPMSTEISIADTDTNLEITAVTFKFSDIAVTLGATAVTVEHTTDIDLAVDIAHTTTAINQQTAPQQGTYTAPTETREFLINTESRTITPTAQTRQLVLNPQVRTQVLNTQTRTTTAEALE